MFTCLKLNGVFPSSISPLGNGRLGREGPAAAIGFGPRVGRRKVSIRTFELFAVEKGDAFVFQVDSGIKRIRETRPLRMSDNQLGFRQST